MEIKKRMSNNVIIFELKGVLDILAKPYLSSCIRELESQESIKVMLDFSGVTAIHTAGLGVLVSLYKEVVSKKGQIKFAGMNADIFELFQVTRLIKVFEIYDKEEDALKSFS